jgi:anthranilate/para-aminobenzoate synthase component II
MCSLGEPQDSGISLQTILELGPTIPIFGVCMGLQCIGEAFGGNIYIHTRSLVFLMAFAFVPQTFMT